MAGLLCGAVLSVGGLYIFANVYMRVAAGSSSDGPRLPVPEVAVADTVAGQEAVPADWTLQPVEGGGTVEFGSLEGHPILVNVWAPWCKPCRPTVSTLQALHDSTEKNIRVALVSTAPRDSVRRYLDNEGISLPAYVVEDVPAMLGGTLVPRTYVVRSDRRIVYRRLGPADWNAEPVHRMLAQMRTSVAQSRSTETRSLQTHNQTSDRRRSN